MPYFYYLHMPSRFLFCYKIIIKTLLPYKVTQPKRKQSTMANSLTTQVKKRLFQAFTAVSVSSSFAGKGCTDTNALWKTLWIPLLLRKELLLDGFPSVSFVVDMHNVEMCSFCLLASMEQILIPNCSLLYLHSSDMISFKSVFLKKVIAINTIRS